MRSASPHVKLLLSTSREAINETPTDNKDNIVRERLLIVVALLGAAQLPFGMAQEPGVAVTTQKPAAQVDPSETDIKLIRAGSEVFVTAFNKHDAKAVAALWTEDGEYIDDTGRTIAGRDAIEKDYAAFFAEQPER